MNKRERLLDELLDVCFDLMIALTKKEEANQLVEMIKARKKEIIEELEYLE